MLQDGQLRIDTPEQIALELPVAGIGSRFLAIAVDTLVQVALYVVAALLFMLVMPAVASAIHLQFVSGALGPALLVLAIFCVYWGYFAIFEIAWKGQTPGKRVAAIRVIRISGRPLDAISAILRNLLRVIDFLPAFYGAGVFCMLVNRHSRRIGDFVAGTIVVHDRPAAAPDAAWSVPSAGFQSLGAAARLTTDEIVLVDTYLARRLELSPETRAEKAYEIVERVKRRTGLAPEPRQNVDDFLERVARDARDVGSYGR